MIDYNFSGPIVVAIGRQNAEGVSPLGTAFGFTTNRIATAAHVIGHSDEGLVAIIPPHSRAWTIPRHY